MQARNNLDDFVKELENIGELVRISTYVDPVLEIAEIVDRVSKSEYGNKALLFENNGTNFPILINAMGSERRMAAALHVNQLDDVSLRLKQLFRKLVAPKGSWIDKLKALPTLREVASFMPNIKKGRGVCQEVIYRTPNLDILPILKCWPADAGRFITLPVIHTKDIINNVRNVGMYRMQVYDQQTTGMHWHLHKVSAKHFYEYKRMKTRMPVAVSLGGDPVYTYCATAPLPENIDEYILAGFLRKKTVQLVNCLTQPDVQVPADADIVIEGYIDPNEPLRLEGPFGDHTGYYSLEDMYPSFHITCITHRKNAIYPATIVGIPPQEDAWIGKATERIFIAPIQLTMAPEVSDMVMPPQGIFHNLVLLSLRKEYAGQAIKCINALWGAGQMMLNKVMIAFDDSINIQKSISSYIQGAFTRFNPATNCIISKGPLDVLDHSSQQKGYGGKLGIDLTTPFEEERDDRFHFRQTPKLLASKVKGLHKKLQDVNTSLTAKKIPCIILSVESARFIPVITKKMIATKWLEGIKLVIFTDATINVQDISLASWVLLNHIDPLRDVHIEQWSSKYKPTKKTACMFLDATSKIGASFQRDWPNPIASNRQTIEKIDHIWSTLNLGELIKSPSLTILDMQKGSGAYCKKHVTKVL